MSKGKVKVHPSIVEVPLNGIGPYPWRREDSWISAHMEDERAKGFRQELDTMGMVDPILVIEGSSERNPEEENGIFYVICGFNRWFQARYTQRYKKKIPAHLVEGLNTYDDVANYAIKHNLYRKDLGREDGAKSGTWVNAQVCLARARLALAMGYDPDRPAGRPKKGEKYKGHRDFAKEVGVSPEILREDIKLYRAYQKDSGKVHLSPAGCRA